MSSGKKKRLEAMMAALQLRWGQKALQPGDQAFPPTAEVSPISTSFPSLDRALDGIGGIPRRRLTEILGAPTSGMATLALKIIATAQAEGNLAVYIDLGATFDPDYAARCLEKGCRMLTLANETLALRRGVDALKECYAELF